MLLIKDIQKLDGDKRDLHQGESRRWDRQLNLWAGVLLTRLIVYPKACIAGSERASGTSAQHIPLRKSLVLVVRNTGQARQPDLSPCCRIVAHQRHMVVGPKLAHLGRTGVRHEEQLSRSSCKLPQYDRSDGRLSIVGYCCELEQVERGMGFCTAFKSRPNMKKDLLRVIGETLVVGQFPAPVICACATRLWRTDLVECF